MIQETLMGASQERFKNPARLRTGCILTQSNT
jgi:hypothetical protein